ncbi:MAG TPA: L,D-transpeptidase family protein [Sphingomicrobium sp.]
MKRVLSSIAAVCAIAVAQSVYAQGSATSAPLALIDDPRALKPGQWVWAAQDAPEGPVLVYVDLTRQIATVYRNGFRIAVTTVSTGRPGFATPTGVFTILQRDANHHSSKYNDAPMPFTERLTWQGVALHAGGLPGYPSSHGCVHLPLQFAKLLFGIESLGGTVIIAGGGDDDPNMRPAAGLLEPAIAGAHAPAPLVSGQAFNWNPAASASGPVSIIISTADQQVVVLRNGIEIGRSKAELPRTAIGTNVMTYAAGKPAHWVEVGASGPDGTNPALAESDGVEDLKLPTAFGTAIRTVIVPGTTLVVTDQSLSKQSTGVHSTVLDAQDTTT